MKRDFTFNNQGSICLLVPESESAKSWIDENIGQDNGYQPYYPTIVVEHRYINDIVEGLRSDGLTV